ncbi:hypothetical protein ACFWU5_16120 [Nocardia sp. NPDC058640]|uniref:hypothetical protein n=1 Tax=Nocardia sp. NPDC058640 TaxID=3346571 RepID=UPI003650F636
MSAPLPTGTRWVAATPGTSTSTSALPTGTRARLPSRMYVPPPIAASTAEGTLTATVVLATTAPFTTTGTVTATSAPALAAVFTTEGVFVVPTDRVDANSSATGLLGATATPSTTAPFTAVGTPSGAQAAALSAPFSAEGALLIPTSQAVAPQATEGTLTASSAPAALAEFTATAGLSTSTRGTTTAPFTASANLSGTTTSSTTAPFTAAGALGAVAVNFLPSGMNKSGSAQALATSYALIQNWTADTGAYPGSTVTTHGVVVQGGKTGATVASTVSVQNQNVVSQSVTLRLKVNGGTVLVTGTPTAISAGATGNVSVSTTADVVAGDIITLEAIKTGSGGMQLLTGSGSWVRVT